MRGKITVTHTSIVHMCRWSATWNLCWSMRIKCLVNGSMPLLEHVEVGIRQSFAVGRVGTSKSSNKFYQRDTHLDGPSNGMASIGKKWSDLTWRVDRVIVRHRSKTISYFSLNLDASFDAWLDTHLDGPFDNVMFNKKAGFDAT